MDEAVMVDSRLIKASTNVSGIGPSNIAVDAALATL